MSVLLKTPTAAGGTPHKSSPQVVETVGRVLEDIRANGDSAVRKYSEQFDTVDAGIIPARPKPKLPRSCADLPTTVIDDLTFVQRQVRNFAQAQRDSMLDVEIETLPGVRLGHKHVPVSASGAYVPGGRYPLTASAHMTVVTAKVAGVERVAATTPPNQGSVPPISVAAMHLAGADEIYVLGRRASHRRAGAGYRDDRPGQPAHRPGQRLRRRGQASDVRRGRHRPVRRTDRGR